MFFVNGKRVLLVVFIRYTLLYTKLLNNILYYFLETKIYFVKKIVQYLLRFMYLFCPKISKNDSRKSFIKGFLNSILYALYLVYIIFPLISMT